MLKTKIKTLSVVSFVLLGIQGCAPSSYVVDAPTPSNIQYQISENTDSQKMFSIIDQRDETEKTFSYGVLKADLMLDGIKFDPIDFLKQNVSKELKARGVNASISERSDVDVNIQKLTMRNHRTNAYTPFITLTMLSADIETKDESKRVGVFIKRGKVPVWSFDEIIEPTLNQPLDLLVKEFSAKLNTYVYGAAMSDEDVQSLIRKINNAAADSSTYLDVYQLGFSNNKLAIAPIVELTKSRKEYIRMAAISSLGTIGAEDQLDYLKKLARTSETWTDRAMAIKAIGDIGNADAITFLKTLQEELRVGNEREQVWSTEIINLYI